MAARLSLAGYFANAIQTIQVRKKNSLVPEDPLLPRGPLGARPPAPLSLQNTVASGYCGHIARLLLNNAQISFHVKEKLKKHKMNFVMLFLIAFHVWLRTQKTDIF